jgi:hypothetical protein
MQLTLRYYRFAALFGAMLAGSAVAQTWVDLGPGPSHGGQVEGITNREVVGAVNALAANSTNVNVLYAGGTNGGVWRTDNATAASPTWVRLTDALGSLSIGALELDPTDATRQTVLAGVARSSSLGGEGGALIGLLRSTNSGANWTVLTGGTLTNRALVGVAGRGATLVVATDQGVFRSTNTGTAFGQVSGQAGTGLPAGDTSDLASDPTSTTRLYVPVRTGAARGIYRSTDTGASWVKVSDATVDAPINASAAKIELVVGNSGQVYVAVVNSSGRLADVFRSPDGSTGWVSLGVPTTIEENGVVFGAHPGGQGGTHLSLAADPGNVNLLYLAGDRQPYFGEGVPNSQNYFPNSSGALDYSGRSFKCDASLPAPTRWTRLTHIGAAGNTAPHADSRDMVFDAGGSLIESDDGGVYKRASPSLVTGAWTSLNGSLQTTEYHNIAYDALNNRAIGGAQDTGTTEQRMASGSKIFDSVLTADGGDTAVEDRSSATASTRYSSFQYLGAFNRRVFNASNTVTSTVYTNLTAIGGSPAMVQQFYTPIAVNEASGTRVIFGADNGVYESTDRGDTVNRISTSRINAFRGSPIVSGVPGNAELLLFGTGSAVHLRTVAATAPVLASTLAATVYDVAVDPDTPTRMFALTASTVQFSTTSASAFTNVTGNLISGFAPGTLRSMAFIPGSAGNPDALVVGADRGIYVARDSSGFSTWSVLGSGLPNAIVYEMEYDQADNVLIAGTLGRGAWSLSPPLLSNIIFQGGFE